MFLRPCLRRICFAIILFLHSGGKIVSIKFRTALRAGEIVLIGDCGRLVRDPNLLDLRAGTQMAEFSGRAAHLIERFQTSDSGKTALR